MTPLYPLVGDHQQPLQGSRKHQKGHKELPGSFSKENIKTRFFQLLQVWIPLIHLSVFTSNTRHVAHAMTRYFNSLCFPTNMAIGTTGASRRTKQVQQHQGLYQANAVIFVNPNPQEHVVFRRLKNAYTEPTCFPPERKNVDLQNLGRNIEVFFLGAFGLFVFVLKK